VDQSAKPNIIVIYTTTTGTPISAAWASWRT